MLALISSLINIHFMPTQQRLATEYREHIELIFLVLNKWSSFPCLVRCPKLKTCIELNFNGRCSKRFGFTNISKNYICIFAPKNIYNSLRGVTHIFVSNLPIIIQILAQCLVGAKPLIQSLLKYFPILYLMTFLTCNHTRRAIFKQVLICFSLAKRNALQIANVTFLF